MHMKSIVFRILCSVIMRRRIRAFLRAEKMPLCRTSVYFHQDTQLPDKGDFFTFYDFSFSFLLIQLPYRTVPCP